MTALYIAHALAFGALVGLLAVALLPRRRSDEGRVVDGRRYRERRSP